ncbi:hypothetical protein CYA_1185 [Synechococcus sp. JA-3-3Ab]|nr:hypothetical protein CYA_1185 [Synechococcus sp. JA-3-3Ab]
MPTLWILTSHPKGSLGEFAILPQGSLPSQTPACSHPSRAWRDGG